MTQLIVANWKMNGSIAAVKQASKVWRNAPQHRKVVLCPPFPFLPFVSFLAVGGQNCSFAEEGAFTGEVSARHLKDVGCTYVLIGHSERQRYETKEEKLKKIDKALANNLIPIVCLSESHDEILCHFLKKIEAPLYIAYEPLSAIGTGQLPPLALLENTLSEMRSYFQKPILYGGSVRAFSASALLSFSDGLLVGGASLDIQEFKEIIHAP